MKRTPSPTTPCNGPIPMGMDSATTMRQVQAEMAARKLGAHHRLIVVVALIQMAMNGQIPMTIGPYVFLEWVMETLGLQIQTNGVIQTAIRTEIRMTFN